MRIIIKQSIRLGARGQRLLHQNELFPSHVTGFADRLKINVLVCRWSALHGPAQPLSGVPVLLCDLFTGYAPVYLFFGPPAVLRFMGGVRLIAIGLLAILADCSKLVPQILQPFQHGSLHIDGVVSGRIFLVSLDRRGE